jgi:hypothetical protein
LSHSAAEGRSEKDLQRSKNSNNSYGLKQIMHSARALFLTFLAPEKSKINNTLYENCTTAEREGWQKITSGAKNSNNSYGLKRLV